MKEASPATISNKRRTALLGVASALAVLAFTLLLVLPAQVAAVPGPDHCEQPDESTGKPRGGGPGCSPNVSPTEAPTEVPPTEVPPTEVPPTPTPFVQEQLPEPTSEPTVAPTAIPTATAVPPTPVPDEPLPPTATAPAFQAFVAPPTNTPVPTETPTPSPTAVPIRPAATAPTPPPIQQVAGVQVVEPVGNFLSGVDGVSGVSTDLLVVGTNMTLALLALVVVLVATTMFNATVKENGEEISMMFSRLAGFAGLGMVAHWFTMSQPDGRQTLPELAKPLAITLFTGAFYALVQPDFGWNDKTLVLIAALATSVTIMTVIFEGGQVLWTNRYQRESAEIQVYPVGLLIALVSVALTRLTNLHPGVIFGFVAAAALAPRQSPLSPREQGMSVLVPMVSLLASALIAFLCIDTLRDFEDANPGPWGTFPVTVAVAIFIGGAEGALLTLLPLTFNDGQKIWKWNPLVWLGIALPATFLFIHVVVNEEDYSSLTEGTNAATLLIAAGGLYLVAAGTWFYFRWKKGRQGAEATAD